MVDSLGMERIGQHGFPCVLRHPSPRRLESTALANSLQALKGGLSLGPLAQLRQLHLGPALQSRSTGGFPDLAWARARVWVRVGESWGLAAVVGRWEES